MALSISQITEIAAIASSRAPSLIHSTAVLSNTHLQKYLSCSRHQFSHWFQQLNELANIGSTHGPLAPNPRRYNIFQEIFATEILTRVWATILVAHGRLQYRAGPEQLATHVVQNHNAISHRVLSMLNADLDISMSELAKINHFRRKSERWTNVLINHIGLTYEIVDFLHNQTDSKNTAASHLGRFARAVEEPICSLFQSTIRSAFSLHSGLLSPQTTSLAKLILRELPENDTDRQHSLSFSSSNGLSNATPPRLRLSKRVSLLPKQS